MFLLKKSNRIIQNGLRQYNKIPGTKVNPGIHKRRKLLADHMNDQEEADMDFDELESDFMNVHQTHRYHVEQMERVKEQTKYHIVKRKYFKVKNINFLTWHDKEQMKYLYASDPEEWTVEKLSEGFPALPETVIKIVHSNFKKKELKIRNHDASVQRNWESFKKGELPNLPDDLVEHLNKFTNRALNLKPFVIPTNKREITIKETIPPDFSEIITSYERLKHKNRDDTKAEINLNDPVGSQHHEQKDTYLTVNKSDMKDIRSVTLSQLHSNIEQKASQGGLLSEDEKVILKDIKQAEEPAVVPLRAEEDYIISQNKYSTRSGGALAKKTERDYSHLIYPQQIRIPRNQVKNGYTYRLNDCYYDSDGEFLYRVPGMG